MPCSWTEQEVDTLAKALVLAYKTQTTYKEPLDLKDRVLGWRMVLGDKLTMEQVLTGIAKHMERSTDMPVPAHINNIMNPEQKEITTAQYINAKEQWKINGYSPFCNHKDVVKAYEKQLQSRVAGESSEKQNINKIIHQSVRKIT